MQGVCVGSAKAGQPVGSTLRLSAPALERYARWTRKPRPPTKRVWLTAPAHPCIGTLSIRC